jgi:glucosamine--fructose-6-phosphate aminotransferase (isomerizing)
VAVVAGGTTHVRRALGRLSQLEERLREEPLSGPLGIGHTRWATHGEPAERNAHPHRDGSGALAVVHNGVIENYQALRESLLRAGHRFESETDTEVLPHLIEQKLVEGAGSVVEAVRAALAEARGAYAVGIITRDDPDTLYAARLGSPLVIGIAEGAHLIASDVPALIDSTRRVVYLEDGQLAALRRDRLEVWDLDGNPVAPRVVEVDLAPEAADRAGFETFMLKEIHEQPRVLRGLLHRHTTDAHAVQLRDFAFDAATLRGLHRIMAISCGTAYHAAMYGKLLLEALTDLAVETDLGSEFRYRRPRLNRTTLVLAVSQSGETADTLASVRMARDRGCRILSICNVPGSSLVRESDAVLYTSAGPEIGVASTKAYTTQLMAFALFGIATARARGDLDADRERDLVRELRRIPNAIHYVIRGKDRIRAIAEKHHDGPSSLYLGRRFDVPTALEGALKNKEISYQHAEGYPAGEMKHGPIALINEYLPVICICTQTRDEVYEKTLSNIQEVQARHGRIICVATEGDRRVAALAEDVIYVPAIAEEFAPMVNVVALQLLAYYSAQSRGTDIDKPRNLAKSVTVE